MYIIHLIIINIHALSDRYIMKIKKYRILTYRSNDGNKFVNVWHMDFIALRSITVISFWNNNSIKCIIS